jgi:hypothetical protein
MWLIALYSLSLVGGEHDTRTEYKEIHSQCLSREILLVLEFPLLSNQDGLVTTKPMIVDVRFGWW